MDALDDFAGPGGWSEGLRALDLADLGVEWDADSCRTAEAADHDRLHADVWQTLDHDLPETAGYIGSPPCTALSAAGGKGGRWIIPEMINIINAGFDADGAEPDTEALINSLAERLRKLSDHPNLADADAAVSVLMIVPAIRILRRRPDWFMLEQVPAALPMWKTYCARLHALGYQVWTGVVTSADYGVPQYRRRAVVLGRKTEPIMKPPTTHQAPRRWRSTRLVSSKPSHVSVQAALGRGRGRPSQGVTGAGTFGSNEYYREWAADLGADRYVPKVQGLLQTFPINYPWQGDVTSKWTQVGNAVPPRLASNLVGHLLGIDDYRKKIDSHYAYVSYRNRTQHRTPGAA